MHIAYLHYLVADDTARHHVRQFADGVRSLGHQIEVFAMNLHPADGGGAAGLRSISSGVRSALKRRLGRYLHEPKELLWNVRYVWRELALLKVARPDVLLVRDHLFTASCVPVARWLKLPLVLEVNAPAEESGLYLEEYVHLPRVPDWLEGYKLRRADGVVVVSSSLKDLFKNKYGLADERILVVPNGADPALFQSSVAPSGAIAGFSCDGPVVGFVGSFHRWHGVKLLCRMIREVSTACPRARFLLVGDGPEAGEVRELVRALPGRVVLTGRVAHDRVPALVAAFDVGVMPESNFYGSPLKVIEWMMAGKAIVAPGYAPLLDVIDSGVHGLLFPPGDGGALVREVLRLLGDPGLRQRLGKAAATRAGASLSWRDNARRVLEACDRAVCRGTSVV